ncbi:MAG: DUF934 domain-containing protein [Gammaproteobacteria bacterium]|nr:MAG: DUF934 domain-containing protein [Gammaproteobacteria bacterium]
MRNLIIGRQAVAEDGWQLLDKAFSGALPDGKVIVPLAYWQAHQDSLSGNPDVGVWLDSDEGPETLAGQLTGLPMIAIRFPAFADGRGYSTARILRDRMGYHGDLRAFGDVLRDQLFYLQRCGFSSFAIREDRSAEDALASLGDFSVSYQGGSDDPQPLFRKRFS